MAKRYYIVAVVTVMLAVVVAVGPARAMLLDVAGHWASGIVTALESKGMISGDDLGRFNPDAPLTRAELAKLVVVGLSRESDAKLLAQSPSRFLDVPSYHWAKGYIESLAESGVTDGYPDGRFGPADTVTRAQMAQFLVRAASLADEARLRSREQTTYQDDLAIPDWARGAVTVARDYGLMAGLDDGTFQPNQPVTRAQGSVGLARLMEYRGTLYQITGTLVRMDPLTRQGVVRDSLGNERAISMSPTAQYYRSGNLATVAQIQRLDQVWITMDESGQGRFMEARYAAVVGTAPKLQGTTLTLVVPGGTGRSFTADPGVLIYLNGRGAQLNELAAATDVLVIVDVVTGNARVIDALTANVRGVLTSVDRDRNLIVVTTDGLGIPYQVDRSAVIMQAGHPATLTDLVPGAPVRFFQVDKGPITFLWAER